MSVKEVFSSKIKITKTKLVVLLGIYAFLFVFGTGVYQGVFLVDFGLEHWLTIDEDDIEFQPSAFWESFVASALQDVLFFLGVGYLLFLHNNKDPKDDDFTTKVNYFYPDVAADSEHMKYLIEVMNKSSCVALKTQKTLSIGGVQGGMIQTDTVTYITIKNLHHNHNLVKNEGLFKLIPDKCEYPDGVWGRVNEISIKTESSPLEWIARSEKLSGEAFAAPYKIKLKAGEEGELRSSHSMWGEIGEPSNMKVQMYTREYELHIDNKLEDIDIEVRIRVPGSTEASITKIPASKGLDAPVIISNFKPGTDVLSVLILPIIDQEIEDKVDKPNQVEGL